MNHAFALVLLIWTLGCASTVRIKSGTPQHATTLPGIPFYAKVGVCRYESSWLEPRYTLTLTETENSIKGPARTAVLSQSAFERLEVKSFVALLSSLNGQDVPLSMPGVAHPYAAIKDGWAAVIASESEPQREPLVGERLAAAERTHDLQPISEIAKVDSVVDYGTTYYYNASRPWIGSSQIEADLASDGTLTKGTAQAEDKTLSTILDTVTTILGLPSGSLANKAPKDKDGQSSAAVKVQVDSFTLEITRKDLRHTHTASQVVGPTFPIQSCLPRHNMEQISWTVGELTAEKSETDPNTDTINVTGTIQLPKAAAKSEK